MGLLSLWKTNTICLDMYHTAVMFRYVGGCPYGGLIYTSSCEEAESQRNIPCALELPDFVAIFSQASILVLSVQWSSIALWFAPPRASYTSKYSYSRSYCI